jgi:hypothetical protein
MQDIGIYRGQLAPAYGRTRVAKIAPFWKLRKLTCLAYPGTGCLPVTCGRVAADREDLAASCPGVIFMEIPA